MTKGRPYPSPDHEAVPHLRTSTETHYTGTALPRERETRYGHGRPTKRHLLDSTGAHIHNRPNRTNPHAPKREDPPFFIFSFLLLIVFLMKSNRMPLTGWTESERLTGSHTTACTERAVPERMGEALLYAEAKLGELLKEQTSRGGSMDGKRGSKPSLPNGISHKQSHFAQTLADHPVKIMLDNAFLLW